MQMYIFFIVFFIVSSFSSSHRFHRLIVFIVTSPKSATLRK